MTCNDLRTRPFRDMLPSELAAASNHLATCRKCKRFYERFTRKHPPSPQAVQNATRRVLAQLAQLAPADPEIPPPVPDTTGPYSLPAVIDREIMKTLRMIQKETEEDGITM